MSSRMGSGGQDGTPVDDASPSERACPRWHCWRHRPRAPRPGKRRGHRPASPSRVAGAGHRRRQAGGHPHRADRHDGGRATTERPLRRSYPPPDRRPAFSSGRGRAHGAACDRVPMLLRRRGAQPPPDNRVAARGAGPDADGEGRYGGAAGRGDGREPTDMDVAGWHGGRQERLPPRDPRALLLRYSPAKLRLALIDPKRVEFSDYRAVPQPLRRRPGAGGGRNAPTIRDAGTGRGAQSSRTQRPGVCGRTSAMASDRDRRGAGPHAERVITASEDLAAKGRAAGVHPKKRETRRAGRETFAGAVSAATTLVLERGEPLKWRHR